MLEGSLGCIAIDSGGDLIVANSGADNGTSLGTGLRINPTDGTTTIITDNVTSGGKINEPNSVTIDSNGDLIVTEDGSTGGGPKRKYLDLDKQVPFRMQRCDGEPVGISRRTLG